MTDEFYTKHPEYFKESIQKYINSKDILIEPSCGDGAFLKVFEFSGAYDIVRKTDDDVFEQKDFLTTTNEPDDIPEDSVYIGNPPFGINSTLAIKFCQHCCELRAKFIMFILPVVFENESYQDKAFDSHYHLLESIPYNEFTKDGKDVKVECVFQIWQRQEKERCKTSKSKIPPKFFSYIPRSRVKDLNPDDERVFSIRRVGSTTPELTPGIHESLEDHHVIKLNDDVPIDDFVKTYNAFNFELSPSTKQKHITQQKLNEQINEFKLTPSATDDKDEQIDTSFSDYESFTYSPIDDEEIRRIDERTMNKILTGETYKTKLHELKRNLDSLPDLTIESLDGNEFIHNLLIVPQSKATNRGNLFNEDVVNEFKRVLPEEAKVYSEYEHSNYFERLDVYIEYNRKSLCVFNQIDLWTGGEQLNRCSKYLNIDGKDNDELLCIIVNKPTFKSKKSKAYKFISTNYGKHVIWFSEIEKFCRNYFKM